MQIVHSNHGCYFSQYQQTYPAEFHDQTGFVERRMQLCDEVSRGELVEICFQGVRLHYGQFQTNRSDVIRTTEDFPSVELLFQLKGHTARSFGAASFGERQHNLSYRPYGDGLSRFATGPHQYVGVQLTETFFSRFADATSPALERVHNSLVCRQAAMLCRQNLPIGPALQAQLERLGGCGPHQPLKRLYLELLVLDLLRQQLEQADAQTGRPTTLKPTGVEKVLAVKELLEANPLGDYSLLSLARWAGLNDYKLKRGFRELLGTTVFGYLNHLRMHYARQLLRDGGRTVSEVADVLGYRETHHFSAAFKRTFGQLPSQFIR